MGSKILAIVCANGLGHFRRTIGIFDRLLGMSSVSEVSELTIACERWQWERTKDWDAAARVRARARAIEGIAHPGPGWTRDPAGWEDGRLLAWEARAAALAEMRSADFVVSDNLAGVLAVRRDAILFGSFLWSDVLAPFGERPAVREFVEHERALLGDHRPPMVCVADVVMPGVRARARAIEVGWMCERPAGAARAAIARGKRARVMVLGGATGAAADVLAPARSALAEVREVEVVEAAGFDRELELDDVDVVVCRPGVGTLTQCVAARVPMVLAYESGNVELEHNAAAVATLGGAIDCGANPASERVVEAVRRVISAYEEMSAALAGRASDGLDRAAAWLNGHLAE